MPAESLRNIQRRFFAGLLHPLWGESRDKTPLPGDGPAPPPGFFQTADNLLTPSATLEPWERLELYHRQYWFRLIDALDEDFPALKWLLGDDEFFALLERYLVANPPTAYSLRYLGAGLPAHIADHDRIVPYAVHAEDLATLEYALCMAREAPDLPAVAPASLPSARLVLQPHLRFLSLRTAAEVLHDRALRKAKLRHLPQPKPQANRVVAVFRHQGGVHYRRLSQPEHAFLMAIGDTHRLDLAIDRALALPSDLRPKDQGTVQAWFQSWCAHGWLAT